MRRHSSRRAGAIFGLAVVFGVVLSCLPMRRLLAAQKSPPEVALRLAGVWKFRPDISTKPRAQGTQPQPSGGNRGGGQGGRGGGGGGLGGRGGPTPGGMGGTGGGSGGSGGGPGGGGGYGGGYNGGIGGIGSGGVDVPASGLEQYLLTRAVNREIAEAAETLTVTLRGDEVTFVNDLGDVRTFNADGKKHKLDLLTVKIDTTALWNADILTIRMTAGRMTVTQTFQVSVQGNMLVIDVRAGSSSSRRGGGGAQPAKRVYERVPTRP